jgi:hypothetical protein
LPAPAPSSSSSSQISTTTVTEEKTEENDSVQVPDKKQKFDFSARVLKTFICLKCKSEIGPYLRIGHKKVFDRWSVISFSSRPFMLAAWTN